MKKFVSVLSLISLLAVGSGVWAQETSLHVSGNHMSIGTDLTIDNSDTMDLDFNSAYSIAGVLDIGFRYVVSVAVADEYWTDIGLTYSVTPVKQRLGVPVSFQIYGAYGFRSTQSDFLVDNRLNKEGQGYTTGVIVSHRFGFGPTIALDVGALGEFARRTETTSLTFVYDPVTFVGEPGVDYAEYPLVERVRSLKFGGRLGVAYLTPNHHSVELEVAALVDATRSFSLRPGINVTLSSN